MIFCFSWANSDSNMFLFLFEGVDFKNALQNWLLRNKKQLRNCLNSTIPHLYRSFHTKSRSENSNLWSIFSYLIDELRYTISFSFIFLLLTLNVTDFQPDDNANRNLELNWAWYSNGSSSPNPTNVYPTESFTGKILPLTQYLPPKFTSNLNPIISENHF